MGSLIISFILLPLLVFAAGTPSEIRVLSRNSLSNLNLIEQVDPLLWRIRPLVFKTLLNWDSKTGSFTPSLASEWEWNKDFTELEITLDEKANWEDGKPVSAEDVEFSIGLHAIPESKSFYLKMYQEFILNTQVLSPKKIQINFKSPSYYHLVSVGLNLQIYPRHIYRGSKGEVKWTKKWIGSGDYKLSKFKPDRSIEFESKTANPNLKIDFIRDLSRRSEEIKRGGADWAELSWNEALNLKKKKENLENTLAVPLVARSGVIWLLLNHENPHLASTEVRQALLLGFDRKGANSKIYESQLNLGSGYWPSAHAYASTERFNSSFDIKAANQKLKAAGYSDSDKNGILDRKINGQIQELSFQLLSMSDEDGPLVDLFIQSMKTLGVKVTLEKAGAHEASRKVSEGKYDAYILHIDKFYEDLNLKFQFHTERKQKWPVMRLKAKNQARLDKLLSEAERAFDPAKRRKIQQQVDQILSEETPHLFWYEIPQEFWLTRHKNSSPPY